jgi:hypothetical protein
MKYLAALFVFVLLALSAFCGEGLPILLYGNWPTLTNNTNTATFHELHSTTNLPPEVRGYILMILGSMGVQANDRQRMAEPGEPLTAGCRLVWAATDSTNYIVHYEFVTGYGSTNFCITAAVPDPKSAKLECCNGGYLRRLKDYRDFIDYERHIFRR